MSRAIRTGVTMTGVNEHPYECCFQSKSPLRSGHLQRNPIRRMSVCCEWSPASKKCHPHNTEAYQLRPHTGSLAPHAMDTSQHGPQDWLGDDGDSQPCEDYWWLKLPAKFLFYGRNMKQWQIRTTAQWPSCQWDNEGKAHIFLSPEEVACQLWTAALHNVFTWQQRANMKLLLWQDLIVLCWWHDGEERYPGVLILWWLLGETNMMIYANI